MIISFDRVISIDYYDGVVRGIGESRTGWFLIVLSYFEPNANQKKFALLPIESRAARQILDLLDNDQLVEDSRWRGLCEKMDELILGFDGDYFEYHSLPAENVEIKIHPGSDLSELKKLVPYDIEKVIDDSRFSNLE